MGRRIGPKVAIPAVAKDPWQSSDGQAGDWPAAGQLKAMRGVILLRQRNARCPAGSISVRQHRSPGGSGRRLEQSDLQILRLVDTGAVGFEPAVRDPEDELGLETRFRSTP